MPKESFAKKNSSVRGLGDTGVVIENVREELLAKQREIASLVADLTVIPETNASMNHRNRGDRSLLGAERHAQAATLHKLIQHASEIERALAKLDEGSYGVCDGCGDAIPDGRLEIHPRAVRCVSCAAHP